MRRTGRLSLCLTALREACDKAAAEMDDLDAFDAPSECYGDVRRGQAARLFAVVRRFGYGCEELLALAEERTTARVLWCGSLAFLGSLADAMGERREEGCSRRARRLWRVT